MNYKKNVAGNLLPMMVTEGVTVNVLLNEQHEYLMTGKEVARGYGVTDYNIRQHKLQRPDELLEGKHFVIAVSIPNGDKSIPHNSVLWTKRGIVRLGFFIKSERAKLFRDWAEDLMLEKIDQVYQASLFDLPTKQLQQPRKHNRLTQERLLSIMSDVCKIDDKELRLSISTKLMQGGVLC